MKKRAESYDVGTLENKVEIEVRDAQSSIQSLIGSLNELTTALNNSINSAKTNKLKENVDKTEKVFSALKKTFNFGKIVAGITGLYKATKDVVEANIDLIETNNLFEVSMGKVVDEYGNLDEASSQYYMKAIEFQDKMNEKFATNEMELKKYQSMYYNMLTSQGIDKENSYFISENLIKAGYDIASLYNLKLEDAMEKLQSGLSGQVKGLRSIGIDVSESALERVLNEAGIERSVEQLSYAEKEVARYIAIVQQASKAQGDFARTFEQPANQIKVFKNQLAELKQVAGSFITSMFGNVLVYVNGIIMAIKEILKAFATLFGFDLDAGNSSNLSSTIGIDDVSTGLDEATGKAKQFKNQLMSFDEINNIVLPTSSGSGSSGGTATGIDDKLLKSLKEWNNQMDSLSGKAQEIRDKMLKWLGFKRNDKGGWELEEGLTNFEKILEIVKAIGLAIVGWKVSSTIASLFKNLGLLSSIQSFKIAFGVTLAITGIYLAYKGIKHILEGDTDLFTILETLLGTAAGTFGIINILKSTALGKAIPLGSTIRITAGLSLGITSITTYIDAYKKMLDGNIAEENVLQSAGSILGATVATGMLTKNIPLALIVGLALTIGHVQRVGREELYAPVRNALNLAESKFGQDAVMPFSILLDFGSFTFHGIEKIFGEDFMDAVKTQMIKALKWLLLEFSNYLDKIGWKHVSGAIKSFIKAFEEPAEEQITESIQTSLSNAQNGIDSAAQNSGMQMMLNYKQGIGNKQEELNNTIKEIQNDSLINARDEVNETAQNSGIEMVSKIGAGVNEKSTELNETVKNIQENSIFNNKETFNNLARISGTEAVSNLSEGMISKKQSLQETSNELNNVITSELNNVNTQEAGKQVVNGVATGIDRNKNNWALWGALRSLKDVIVNGVKNLLGIHSPSKVMADLAKFIPLGMAEGIDSEAHSVYESIEKINKGIQVSAKDASIDATSYVDYGVISGNINAQSNVAINSNIVQGIAQAVSSAMKETELNVNIEAKTEEGVIVKKASQGFKDYVMQTGELPFPVPIG